MASQIDSCKRRKLSLQSHTHRSEHWVVVDGIAKVEIDNELILKDNQSSYIRV